MRCVVWNSIINENQSKRIVAIISHLIRRNFCFRSLSFHSISDKSVSLPVFSKHLTITRHQFVQSTVSILATPLHHNNVEPQVKRALNGTHTTRAHRHRIIITCNLFARSPLAAHFSLLCWARASVGIIFLTYFFNYIIQCVSRSLWVFFLCFSAFRSFCLFLQHAEVNVALHVPMLRFRQKEKKKLNVEWKIKHVDSTIETMKKQSSMWGYVRHTRSVHMCATDTINV